MKKEKYIIQVCAAGKIDEEEFVGTPAEVRKFANHIASFVFAEDGDTVEVYKDGVFLYYGRPYGGEI